MGRKLPSISIITPSLNQADFIVETIESVLTQGYRPKEYVVKDGGSKDRTKKILQGYGKKIIWKSKKDNGQSDALNQGCLLVSGDIVGYINSDDYYLKDTFAHVAAQFQKYPEAMWLVGDAIIVDKDGNEIQVLVRAYKKLLRYIYQPWMLGVLNPFPQPAVFWRKKAQKEIGLFNEKLHFTMDYDYWWRLQEKYGPPLIISLPLAAFRIHSTSKGKTMYRRQFAQEEMVGRQYSKNLFTDLLHKIHNQCILLAYGFIKQ